MATSEQLASWIVANKDKQGTPEFETVSASYKAKRAEGMQTEQPQAPQEPKSAPTLLERFKRQAGLTGRYALEGVGSVADALDAPVRVPMGVQAGIGGRIADSLGMPTPETPTERMIAEPSRLVAGSAGFVGAGAKVANLAEGGIKSFSNMLAANPAMQVTSATAAGGAGGYVKENGGSEGEQLAAALAAGIVTPIAVNKLKDLGMSASAIFQKLVAPQQAQNITVDVTINNALKDSGISMADIPAHVQNSIRADVANALKVGDNLSPDALRRLVDYKMVGATPTKARLTLDPADVSQEKNLAKLGINSKDASAQQLGRLENNNNSAMIEKLNSMGAGQADDALGAGNKIIGALDARNSAAKRIIGSQYDAAKASNGRSANIDHVAFTNAANDALDQSLLGGKLPGDVRTLLNNIAQGKMPLTVDVAEQLKTRIGELQRSTLDMAERKALGLVRSSLDDAPLLQGEGQQAINAFNKARGTNRAWMKIVEKTPALQAVRDGVEPDKFVNQFIIGNGAKSNLADVMALRQSIKGSKEAMQAVRQQLIAHLKNKALNGASDEIGSISQSAYNAALRNITEPKLALFFTKEEIAQIKALGRVASYEQVQPRGSAVNNSNTAGAVLSTILDRIGGSSLMSKIPLGNMIAEPVKNIAIGMKSKEALNYTNSLAQLAKKAKRDPISLAPAVLLAGQGNDK